MISVIDRSINHIISYHSPTCTRMHMDAMCMHVVGEGDPKPRENMEKIFTHTGQLEYKAEGYWKDNISPSMPLPQPCAPDPRCDRMDEFMRKLIDIETNPTRYGIYVQTFLGFSSCRLCDKKNNGCREFQDIKERIGTKVVWPEGYRHYLQDHGVAPSVEFYNFIMAMEPTKLIN
eukprot:GEZU01027602.1.p1 GENE.GEZU01027602.1~~GEZU01027602.1.p1  ORF type:complete len:175 (+),score=15.21 GEZU01027602.1:98-622(+)